MGFKNLTFCEMKPDCAARRGGMRVCKTCDGYKSKGTASQELSGLKENNDFEFLC